jgi:hypothetical protein
MNKKNSDKIPGGFADGKSPKDFNKADLDKGVKIEMEHTSDPQIALEVAMDHLTEDERYYEKLEIMENVSLKDLKTIDNDSEKKATPVEIYSPFGPVDNVEQVRYPKNKKEKIEMNKNNSEEGSMLNEIEKLRTRGAAILTNLDKENPEYKKYQDSLTYLDRISDGIKQSDVEEKEDIFKPIDGTVQSDLDKEHKEDVKRWDLNEYNNSYVASELVAIAKSLLED